MRSADPGGAPADGAQPPLAALLALADSRLPVGSHAYSGGLEPAVAAGQVCDLAGLDRFLRGRLATTGRVAAAFAAAACAGAGDPARLAALEAGLDARTPSPAARRVSAVQARALLRAARAVLRADPEAAPTGGLRPGGAQLRQRRHQPVAWGTVAAVAGLTPGQAAGVAAYQAVAGPASAAVKLLGLDPYQVHGLLVAHAPACDEIARAAARGANDPVEALPAASAPMLDIYAETHATWEVRLFAS